MTWHSLRYILGQCAILALSGAGLFLFFTIPHRGKHWLHRSLAGRSHVRADPIGTGFEHHSPVAVWQVSHITPLARPIPSQASGVQSAFSNDSGDLLDTEQHEPDIADISRAAV